jgi:hypothetical protein
MTRQAFAPRAAVVLGASNVALGLVEVASAARRAWRAPLDLYVAAGLGRSYGRWNWILGHSLPGIIQCALWEALEERRAAGHAGGIVALVTDVGNDLLYGSPPDEILSWVNICLERLAAHDAQFVIGQVPIDSIERMGALRFYQLRRVLYPWSRLTWSDAITGATELREGLERLAKKFSCPSVQPRGEWFGWDPIHVRSAYRAAAWKEYCGAWTTPEPPSAARLPRQALGLRMARVHHRRLFGRERICAQPAMRMSDGSTVSLY